MRPQSPIRSRRGLSACLCLSACLSLLAIGCGTDAANFDTGPRIVEMSEIQVPAAGPQFVAVRDMAVGEGTVWILDNAEPFLTRVSVTDGGSRQFGRRGEGPGELRSPQAVQTVAGLEDMDGGTGDGIWVWDIGNHRVSTFDADGTFRDSEPLDENGPIRARSDIRTVSYIDPFRVRSSGGDVLFASTPERIDRTSDVGKSSLQRTDPSLAPGATLVQLADHMAAEPGQVLEWVSVPLWDVCDGTVVLWSPAASRVVWLDMDGTEVASAPVELDPGPVTTQDMEAYLRWMARLELGPDFESAGIDFAAMAQASGEQFASQRPVATDIRCEAGGAAWLRLFDTSVDPVGRGQSWLRVSGQGESRRYTFPSQFVPMVFTADGAYGALEVPEGYQQLAWWGEDTLP